MGQSWFVKVMVDPAVVTVKNKFKSQNIVYSETNISDMKVTEKTTVLL